MPEHPKVFISYSHDSPEHKRWVSELAARLRHNGIDAILDQWDLGPGDDIALFMESGLRDSDRVLVVCTDTYVRKANDREGGVGYEVQIVTAQLIENLGIDKFIPLIRPASGKKKVPTCLEARVYIDFRNESQFNAEFEKLLRELHREPIIKKPPLGKSPFATLPSGQESPPSGELNDQLPDIPEQVDSASDTYSAAVKIARAGDALGWRQLVKRVQPNPFTSLVQWQREKLEEIQTVNTEQWFEILDTATEIISPLICVALAGVESAREQFRDQKSFLDDLLNIVGWHRSENEFWANIPYALAHVYHSLHGSVSLATNQLELALSLAQVNNPAVSRSKYYLEWERDKLTRVWERPNLIGKSAPIGCSPMKVWKYLTEAYGRWEWLPPIFGDKVEYKTSLVAYYMALHIHELASIIASGQQSILVSGSKYRFKVPLTFVSEGQNINDRAILLLLRNPDAIEKLWTCLSVTRDQMEGEWRHWMNVSKNSLGYDDEFIYANADGLTHQHLFQILRG